MVDSCNWNYWCTCVRILRVFVLYLFIFTLKTPVSKGKPKSTFETQLKIDLKSWRHVPFQNLVYHAQNWRETNPVSDFTMF